MKFEHSIPEDVKNDLVNYENNYPRSNEEEELELYKKLKEKYSDKGIKEGDNSFIKYSNKENKETDHHSTSINSSNVTKEFGTFEFNKKEIDLDISKPEGSVSSSVFFGGHKGVVNADPNDNMAKGDQNPIMLFASPFWHLVRDLPTSASAYDWALGIKEQYESNITYSRGGYQSNFMPMGDNPWKDYIMESLDFMPAFHTSGLWVDIRNKGDYHISHQNPGGDATVKWFITDDDTLIINDPCAFNRSSYYRQPALRNLMATVINPKFTSGDFLILPSDITISNEPVLGDTPVITLNFGIKFVE